MLGLLFQTPNGLQHSFQTPKRASPQLAITGYEPDTKRVLPRCCSYFQVIAESYNEKLLSQPNNNHIYSNEVVPLSLKYNLLQSAIRCKE